MASTSEQDTVWTVGRLLDWTTTWFHRRQVEGGRLAAELLLARAMDCRKIDLYTRYDTRPTDQQRADFRELVKRAAEHTPTAYLLGTREFFSLAFQVCPAVMVPRPETEVLVQRMIDLCRQSPERTRHVLDVGTGSGCVAIAVARYAPNATVVGSDVSPGALEVAARNVKQHGLGDQVRLVEADCVTIPADLIPEGGFDAVVSNPPYISEEVFATLPPHIRDHEPKLALTIDGGDGLDMYRRFAKEVPAVLREGGGLLVEIGHDQRDEVLRLFEAAGNWTHVGSYRDPSDPCDRMLEFELR